MSKSKFTNRNRVVDRVIRTIRDAFIGQDMANPKLMQQIVKLYNDKLHSAFDLKCSPSQVNKDEDLEGKYIRSQMKKLNEAKQSQSQLTKLTKGNIILIHLDLSKTALKFNKQRRQFNELAIFEKYQHGNIICRLMKPYKDIQQVEIPIYFTKKVSDDIENLDDKYKSAFFYPIKMEPSNEDKQTAPIIDDANKEINVKRKYERKEGVKCGRPKKYNTIEEAKNKAREQRSAFKKKQYVITKQFRQTITELQRTAIRQIQKVKLDETDIITIINILDKYKQKQMKEITENNNEDEGDESEVNDH
ncbi:MAG: hypothetical protein EZS28_025688 [Streblomastix strix]|uniref:Uncharacterized protein n=1 Tax=Streblomastix strix TaxID=222440 RepID=A0A5J4V8H8_9EUKA|nr:MAG: hypothetical protein EZS28_025688 [Streblomastix strix]